MATALTVVNAVLRRLREASVTDFSSAYATLILDFVNETKRECEDAWRWTMLRQTLTINTVSGTSTYTMTGSRNRWQLTDRNQRIFDSTNKSYLFPMGDNKFEEYKWTANVTNAQPNNYTIRGATGGDSDINLWPTPDGAYVIKVPIYLPQDDLINTTDSISIPDLPIILGAWARAISERGEDQGFKTTDQYILYQNSLSYHIALDVARVSDETDWTPL
jgi:hypothetical protein